MKYPSAAWSHSAAPALDEYSLPFWVEHLRQDVAPVSAEKSPAAHGVQVAEAVDDVVPAGHVVQLVAAAPSDLVPASHAAQYTDAAASW